jgi:hypothetical protein
MKKFLTGLMLLFAFIVAFNSFAAAPSAQPFTVNSGSGSLTYSAGLQNPAFNMFKITAVLLPSAVGTTNTLKVVDGTVTNTLGTKVVAANDCDLLVTNDWWHFIGAKILVECSATNAFTATPIIEEQ